MDPLPIDGVLPEIVRALRAGPCVVVQAPPGSGKTTRVPRAILEGGLAGAGEVVVLQPRRLPTRLAARRVAQEMGSPIGQIVGYQVRFEEVAGPRTRLRFVTEGILTRRLISDPLLRGVGAVVVDEFHERHLEGDLALALARRLQFGARTDLKLVVMSATLDAEPVARFLGDCPIVRAEGRRFDVAVEHLDRPDDRPSAAQVVSAVRRLAAQGLDGHVLAFLPGMAEIRRAEEALRPVAESKHHDLVLLHGDLPPREQDRAVAPSRRPRVILSTNVAETSVTIEGVVAVVDSGLARVASHSPWSGLPVLRVQKVSRASAAQRAGRAGRTRPGRCLRLYTRADHDGRPEHDAPEVRRVDLAAAALLLHLSGIRDLGSFAWFEPPPAAAIAAADALLSRLGASDAGAPSPLGTRLAQLPVHPRLGRLLVEAAAAGYPDPGCALAALLSERDVRAGRGRSEARRVESSDLLDLADRLDLARRARFEPYRVRALGLEPAAVDSVERQRRHLSSLVRGLDRVRNARAADEDAALRRAILAAYPDRVARRRHPKTPEVLLCGGGSARIADESVVREDEFLVAVDAEEQPRAGAPRVLVRLASAIEPDWLVDLFPATVRESREVVFDRAAERVHTVSRLTYEGLVVLESRVEGDPEAESRALAETALAAGPGAFVDPDRLASLSARMRFAAAHAPDAGIAPFGDQDVRDALRAACAGCKSFAELRESPIEAMLLGRIDPRSQRLLDELAPEAVSLPGRARVPVEYAEGRPPSIASRLQDFFGLSRGPSIAGGRAPLVLHLLAPNRQAVQVTSDLAGFWARTYPAVRAQLGRRYPKHAWPEDPKAAATGPARAR